MTTISPKADEVGAAEPSHSTDTADNTSEAYWTEHNVTLHKVFATAEESLDYLHWRNDQYVGYIELLPVAGHDGEVILDFGCGPGHDLVGFHAYSKPAAVIGLDVSSSSLGEARDRLALHGYDCQLIQAAENDQRLPLASGSVDYVHCSGVLNHVMSPENVLAEFRRVLKPTGYARLMVYNFDSLWVHLYVTHVLPKADPRYDGLDLDEAFRRSTDGFDCPVSRNWTIPEMQAMAADAGFRAAHTGNAVSLFELSLLPDRFAAMMDSAFRKESRQFLKKLTFDHRGLPVVDGRVAGIDGCYELRPA